MCKELKEELDKSNETVHTLSCKLACSDKLASQLKAELKRLKNDSQLLNNQIAHEVESAKNKR